MTIKKEENGHFENGDPAYVIWNGEELVAGPLRAKEADAMLKELKPKKKPAAKKPAKKPKVKKWKHQKLKLWKVVKTPKLKLCEVEKLPRLELWEVEKLPRLELCQKLLMKYLKRK